MHDLGASVGGNLGNTRTTKVCCFYDEYEFYMDAIPGSLRLVDIAGQSNQQGSVVIQLDRSSAY